MRLAFGSQRCLRRACVPSSSFPNRATNSVHVGRTMPAKSGLGDHGPLRGYFVWCPQNPENPLRVTIYFGTGRRERTVSI